MDRVVNSLLDPVIIFFVLGVAIGFLRSNLEIPQALATLPAGEATLRRAGKRQSAPFSKGDPEAEPKRSGRKKGKAHGRRRHRAVPSNVDRELGEAAQSGVLEGCRHREPTLASAA